MILPPDTPDRDKSGIDAVLSGMIRTWNDRDALAFAWFFSEDADFVNIHGMHLCGRKAIAAIFQILFPSVFATGTTAGTVSLVRMLRNDVALLHAEFDIEIGSGTHAGSHHVMSTIVMAREEADWKVASMHNTLVTAPGA